MDAGCGQSLAPEWLFLNKESPSSSHVDKSPTRHSNNDRDRSNRRNFGKQNSYHHLIHLSPSSSHSYSLPSSSSNWRAPDHNPRMLNRSKSSPVFDSKENEGEVPKSPDRSNNSSSTAERHFVPTGLLHVRQKEKLKGKPILISSRSQPNLFAADKATWQQPKFRSPPPSRSSSFSGGSMLASSPSSSPTPSSPVPSPSLVHTSSSVVASLPTHTVSVAATPIPEDLDLEMEKLRTLVPSPSVASSAAPKPPTRLNTNRKHSKPHRPEKPDLLQLRKHTSEPLLVNPGSTPPSADDLMRRMRSSKLEKAKGALKETMEDQNVVLAKRNNFLMDVLKREKQIQDSAEEAENNNIVTSEEAVTSATDSEITTNGMLPSFSEEIPSPAGHLSTVEDEERFLRLLGWVPEEEDHVPELDEDEIAEVRLKINNHQQHTSPNSTPRSSLGIDLGLARDMMTVAIRQD